MKLKMLYKDYLAVSINRLSCKCAVLRCNYETNRLEDNHQAQQPEQKQMYSVIEYGLPLPFSYFHLLLTEILRVRVCDLVLIHVGLLKYQLLDQLLGRSVPPVTDNEIT